MTQPSNEIASSSEIVYSNDPNIEHGNLLRTRSAAVRCMIELGLRLLRFKETGDWRKVTIVGPFELWTDYLKNGLHMSKRMAYYAMSAATLPVACSLQQGIVKAALLRDIIDLTDADETVEQAMNLLLPFERKVAEGTAEIAYKSFREMEEEEVADALALIKADKADPVLANSPEAQQLQAANKVLAAPKPTVEGERDPGEDERKAVEKAAREAVTGMLKPRQLRVRELNGEYAVDLKSVPLSQILAVGTALDKLPRK